MEFVSHRTGVSVGEDEDVLEVDGADSYINSVNVLNAVELHTRK